MCVVLCCAEAEMEAEEIELGWEGRLGGGVLGGGVLKVELEKEEEDGRKEDEGGRWRRKIEEEDRGGRWRKMEEDGGGRNEYLLGDAIVWYSVLIVVGCWLLGGR